MTTKEKKEALREAGIKFRSKAATDTIAKLYRDNLDGVTDEVTAQPEPSTQVVVQDGFVSDEPKTLTMKDFEEARETLGERDGGIKTAALLTWADKNLSPDDFNSLYAGRTVNGKTIANK